jgi:hypothetical protein
VGVEASDDMGRPFSGGTAQLAVGEMAGERGLEWVALDGCRAIIGDRWD